MPFPESKRTPRELSFDHVIELLGCSPNALNSPPTESLTALQPQ